MAPPAAPTLPPVPLPPLPVSPPLPDPVVFPLLRPGVAHDDAQSAPASTSAKCSVRRKRGGEMDMDFTPRVLGW
jgi:hypothetical protein